MSNIPDKTKMKIVVKTYLCANKGKWFTSKQLSDFINSNKLGGRFGVTPTELTKFLNPQFLRNEGIDRDRRNTKNVWHYSIGGAVDG